MDMASNESSDALTRIEHRLEALDRKVDERFAAVDRRFEQVDKRFEQVDNRFEQVDKRFDEQRSHSQALYEASRSDFNNLYDFVKAFAESTEGRFAQLEAEHAVRFADIDTAISVLTRRGTPPRRRRR